MSENCEPNYLFLIAGLLTCKGLARVGKGSKLSEQLLHSRHPAWTTR